jgi:CheY-like chemotaxis protein
MKSAPPEVRTMFRSRAEQKGIDLIVDTDCLPPMLHADASRLRQVVVNLTGNAVKFTDTGSVRLSATWREDVQGLANTGHLRIEVADDGIGISDANQSGLFERFKQADASTTRRYGGSGLGLSISREIVEAMDGEIGVISSEGDGSIFWFEVACVTASSASERERLGEGEPPQHSLKLLVAEDNPVNQQIVSSFLKKAGHELVLVEDGEAAVEQVQKEPFDLVLMDMQMPRLDGIGATRAIRALDGPVASLPIIALTAESMHGDRERLLASGLDGYVSKPIDRKQLMVSIAQVHSDSSVA